MNKYFRIFLSLILLLLSCCKEQIQQDLSENDANKYLSKLSQASFEAEKIKQPDGKWSVAVDKSQVVAAIRYLSEARLLKNNIAVPADKNAILSSREDQKFKFERALSHEIENTILSLQSVLDARIHLNMPASDPILGSRLPDAKGSASALLIVKEDHNLTSETIAALISGASGIDKSSITVMLNKESSNPGPGEASPQSVIPVKQSANFAEDFIGENLSKTNLMVLFFMGFAVLSITLPIRGSRQKKSFSMQSNNIGVLNDFEGDIL